MEKKSNQTPRKETNEKEESNYEKLRDELFDYRVTIKTYIKNLNTIIISGTIIFALLAFFGYDKIENIERIIITKVDKRLAITDSILSGYFGLMVPPFSVKPCHFERSCNYTKK